MLVLVSPTYPPGPAQTCRGLLFDLKSMSDRKALAREIAARTKPRFIEIRPERGGVRVPFTEEQLSAMRGGLSAEEYRWKLIRQYLKK